MLGECEAVQSVYRPKAFLKKMVCNHRSLEQINLKRQPWTKLRQLEINILHIQYSLKVNLKRQFEIKLIKDKALKNYTVFEYLCYLSYASTHSTNKTLGKHTFCYRNWEFANYNSPFELILTKTHCLKSHFFRLAESKCFVIYHWQNRK